MAQATADLEKIRPDVILVLPPRLQREPEIPAAELRVDVSQPVSSL